VQPRHNQKTASPTFRSCVIAFAAATLGACVKNSSVLRKTPLLSMLNVIPPGRPSPPPPLVSPQFPPRSDQVNPRSLDLKQLLTLVHAANTTSLPG
jgi:hypothetical protein